jgi:hypothetical protein
MSCNNLVTEIYGGRLKSWKTSTYDIIDNAILLNITEAVIYMSKLTKHHFNHKKLKNLG